MSVEARLTGRDPVLPIGRRYDAIRYEGEDGTLQAVAYPITYDELYNLKGRLLTLVDATFQDPEQRKAQKDLVWQALRSWMSSVEDLAENVDRDGTPRGDPGPGLRLPRDSA